MITFEQLVEDLEFNIDPALSSWGSVWNEASEVNHIYKNWLGSQSIDDDRDLEAGEAAEILESLAAHMREWPENFDIDNMPIYTHDILKIWAEYTDDCEHAFGEVFSMLDFLRIGDAIEAAVSAYTESLVKDRLFQIENIAEDMAADILQSA